MINRYSLAVLIPILLATSTVNSINVFNKNGNQLEIYGYVNPNHEFFNTFNSPKIRVGNDTSNAILGFLAKSKINDSFFGYAKIEYGANLFFPEKLLNGHKNNFLRLGYAGIKFGDFGSIDYGRNYGVMHDAESLTNHIPYIINNSVFSYNDNYMINRNNSLLTYRNNNFFGLVNGLSFSLQYQDKNLDRPVVEQNGLGWGASFKYKSRSGLTTIGSLFSSKIPEKLSNKGSKKSSSVDAYGLGFKYDTKNVYLAAFYGIAKNLTPDYVYKDRSQPYMDGTENIEAVAEYKFASGFYPSLSFLESRGKNFYSFDGFFTRKSSDLVKQINIVTRYKFNNNVSAYVNYKINLLKKNDSTVVNNVAEDNVLNAGMAYQF